MLTIPMGHTLAALTDVLGKFADVSSVLATSAPPRLSPIPARRCPCPPPDPGTGERSIDQRRTRLHSLSRRDGARPATASSGRSTGTKGDIRVSGPIGHAQLVPLSLKGARGDQKAFQTLRGWCDAGSQLLNCRDSPDAARPRRRSLAPMGLLLQVLAILA